MTDQPTPRPGTAGSPGYDRRGVSAPPPALPTVPADTPVLAAPDAAAPAAEPAPADAGPTTRGLGAPRPVLAFFYPWYAEAAWTQPPMSDLPPAPYLSDDEPVMRRQVSQAQNAAIDAFVSSWAGSGSDTDKNFARLLDRCPDGFYACPYFETALIKGDGRDLAHELVQLRDQYMSHPRFFKFGDRPVVFFWAPKAIGAPPGQTSVQAWHAIRQAVDPQAAQLWNVETKDPEPWFEVFDGFHLFSAADWAAPTADDFAPLLRTNLSFRQRADGYNTRHGAHRVFAAGVRPGYNDVAIRAQQRASDPTVPEGYVRDRADGRYYQMSGTAAGQSQPDWIVITSFNEWFEGSQIEPSVSYGDLYLSLTPDLVDAYRAVTGPLPVPQWPPDVRYFPETGHILQRGFLSYWNQPGVGAKLGPPVTDEIGQTLGGQNYVVQYFLKGYRLQWNTSGQEPTRLVTLGPNDWNREPQ
ncbi:MAG TPA: glycoside hydrolase family 99-like domain-containing protein [Chloroflexia bacterium]|nr:glycoside hydrolase family 99-like domain-containing protein [Chloroflexia bacterium]